MEPSIEISAGISKPARRRRRTRHKSSPTAALQPVPVEDPNDGDEDDSIDGEDGLGEAPPPPVVSVRVLPPLQKPPESSDAVVAPVRAVGFRESKVRWAGLQAKERVMHRMNGMVPSTALVRRPSGRRWRAHASDYDEQLAMIHIFKPPLPQTHSEKRRVSAYCSCEQLALFKLLKWLEKGGREARRSSRGDAAVPPASQTTQSFALVGWKNEMYLEVLHSSFIPDGLETTAASNDEEATTRHRAAALQQKHSFFFSSGCCIFWGLTREEEARQLMMLTPFSSGLMDQVDAAQDMEFSYGDESSIAKDAIVLCSTTVAEKIALSFAMAQSATLGGFETRVEDRIRSTKHIPSSLATVGSIQYSQSDTSKLIGQLFIELADVNIHSNVLDEPEYFTKSTDNDDFKQLYEKMLKYQEVANRVGILNKRLAILRDLVGVLNQQLTHHQGTKLEWIVIWMLVFQVVIALGWEILLKDVLGYFHWA